MVLFFARSERVAIIRAGRAPPERLISTMPRSWSSPNASMLRPAVIGAHQRIHHSVGLSAQFIMETFVDQPSDSSRLGIGAIDSIVRGAVRIAAAP